MRYLKTTSLVCRRKIASISFCPDLLPRPRNQFSAGLSATLILPLKRFGGTRSESKEKRKPTFDFEERDGRKANLLEEKKTHRLQFSRINRRVTPARI